MIYLTPDLFFDLSTELKVVLDFVPNHSSKLHQWFTKSESKQGKYTDYYVWADAKDFDKNNTPIPPNNWVGEEWQLFLFISLLFF